MLSISCHFNNDCNEHTMEHQATRVSYTLNPSLEEAMVIVKMKACF